VHSAQQDVLIEWTIEYYIFPQSDVFFHVVTSNVCIPYM